MSAQEKQNFAKRLDLRGLMCPEPVLRTKRVLDGKPEGAIEVLVDTDINVMNLTRLANSLGLFLESEEREDGYQVVISSTESGSPTSPASQSRPEHNHGDAPGSKSAKTVSNQAEGTNTHTKTNMVLFIAKDTFGEGDRDFSVNLINVFLQTVLQAGHKPQAILLANTGVRLMDPDSSVSKVLNEFKEAGTDVFACGLCVEFYGLKDKIAKEQITNMYAICEYLFSADKIISP
ncbi:MAG: sulfurtransferase-like selenium metabolism protein YedF [Candidatus Melainabacteria bacterium]|nr:sulfurtransferase-like selenium metabolism protein YedF [Candidatus Melainabacteria bacterium]